MEAQEKRKAQKVGVVIKSDKNGKFYLILGSTTNKKAEYNFSVELVIKNSAGEVVHTQKDGLLSLLEPRNQGAGNGKVRFDVLA